MMGGWSVGPRLAAAILTTLVVATLGVRVVPIWSQILPESGQVRLLGVDSYYHLRHARFAAHNFPSLQRWDIGTHYPNGQRSDAIGLFDLAIGGVSWWIGAGQPTDGIVDQVCAWTPPVLAAASVVALYLLAGTVGNRATALTAGAVFFVYPGPSLHRTLVGFADHHCAEIVLALLTCWALARFLQIAGDDGSVRSLWRPAFLHAAPLAVFLFTWAGAPIHLLITALTLWAVATVEGCHRGRASATACASFRYGSGLLIIVAGVGWLWPDLVISPTRFPLVLLGCTAIALGPACYHGAALLLACAGAGPRLTGGILSVLVAVSMWLIVQCDQRAHELVQLLTAKGETVAEHQAVTWESYWSTLGVPGLLALIAIPLVLVQVVRHTNARFALVSVVPGVLLTSLWAYSHDYDYMPSPFVALLSTFAIVGLWRRLLALGTTRPDWMRFATVATLAVVLIVPVWPLKQVDVPWATARVGRMQMIISDGWA